MDEHAEYCPWPANLTRSMTFITSDTDNHDEDCACPPCIAREVNGLSHDNLRKQNTKTATEESASPEAEFDKLKSVLHTLDNNQLGELQHCIQEELRNRLMRNLIFCGCSTIKK